MDKKTFEALDGVLASAEKFVADPAKMADLNRVLTATTMSLIGRRYIRKALIALGMDPKAAKAVSKAWAFVPYGITSSYVLAKRRATEFVDSLDRLG